MPVSHRINVPFSFSLWLCQSSIIQLFNSFTQNSILNRIVDLGGILVVVSSFLDTQIAPETLHCKFRAVGQRPCDTVFDALFYFVVKRYVFHNSMS